MKLITLNIWGAQVREPFIDFIKNNQDIDVFCFQEMYDKAADTLVLKYPDVSHDIFTELKELLPEHQGFFRPVINGVYGIAIFIKKEISVLGEGELLIHKNTQHEETSGHHSRNLQWIKFRLAETEYTVINVHGLWNGAGKFDTPDRLAQSQKIKDFVDTISGSKILCGDFNLRPDTESVEILEKGMRNLVKEYGVQSTRTVFYEKEEKFADYIFVPPETVVKDFKVLPDEVSDHAALFWRYSSSNFVLCAKYI